MEGANNARARGRIAEVLAEARASLKEPSRPFTPASLDARTSIDLKALDKFGRVAMTKNPSFGRLPDDYYPIATSTSSSTTRTQSFEDLDAGGGGKGSSKRRSHRSTSSSSTPSSLSSMASEVMLAVYKLKEVISPVDEFMPDDDGGGLKMYNSASLHEICLRSADSVDKIAKYLVKGDSEGQAVVAKDVVEVAVEMSRAVLERFEQEECAVTRCVEGVMAGYNGSRY